MFRYRLDRAVVDIFVASTSLEALPQSRRPLLEKEAQGFPSVLV